MKEHDIFLHKLIQWLGLLRNISCSFAYVLFWYNNGLPHTPDVYRGAYSLWHSFGRVLKGGAHRALLVFVSFRWKVRHEATTHNCDSTGK